MKLQRFNESSKTKMVHKNEYYVLINTQHGEEVEIPAMQDDYNENYDAGDLKDVVRFMVEVRNEFNVGELKIRKITEEDLDNKRIKEIEKEIEMEEDFEKYNV